MAAGGWLSVAARAPETAVAVFEEARAIEADRPHACEARECSSAGVRKGRRYQQIIGVGGEHPKIGDR